VFHIPALPSWSELLDLNAVLIYVGWFVWQLLLAALPAGTIAYGLPLKSGKQLQYRCNGELHFRCSFIMNCQEFEILTAITFTDLSSD